MESRSIDFAKTASIDIMSLNNKVVNMRQLVKRTKVQVINRLCRNISELKKKKGTDEQKEKNIQKAERMIEEIDSIKQLKPDKVSKYALANTSSFEAVCKVTTKAGPRAMARLSTHSLMSKRVEEFRGQHADWRDLTAFLLIKQTGRRFKTKKQKQGNKHAVNVENINASETMTTAYLKEMVGAEAGKHAEQQFERKRRRKILDRRPKKEKVAESIEKKIESDGNGSEKEDDDEQVEPKTKKLKKELAEEQNDSDSDENTEAIADDDSESESVDDAVVKDQSVSDEDDSEASNEDEQDNEINNKIDNNKESEDVGSNNDAVEYNQSSDGSSGEDSGNDDGNADGKTDAISNGKAKLTLERKKKKTLSQNGESVVRELNLEDMDGDDIGSEDDDDDDEDDDDDDEEENDDNDNDDSKSEKDEESDSNEVASDNDDDEDSDSSDDALGLKDSLKKSLNKSDLLLKRKKDTKKNNKNVPDILKGVGSGKKVTRDPFFVFDGSDGSDNEENAQVMQMPETNDFYYQADDPSFEKRHFDSMFHNPEETEIKSGRGRGSSRGDFNRGRGRGDFNRSRGDFTRGRGEFNRGRGEFNRGRGGFIRGGQFGKKQTMGDQKQAQRQDMYRRRGGSDRGRGGPSDRGREGWDSYRGGGDRGRGGGDRGRGGWSNQRGRGGSDRGNNERSETFNSGRDFSSPRDVQPKRFQTDVTTFKSAPVTKAPGPAEKLHPSWEASKKRKEQSGLVAFKGSKKTFDDSD